MSNTTIELLNNHKSIRAFTNQKVSDEIVATILTAANAGPNINNFQPVTFIEITDQKFKAEITKQVGMAYIETAARYFVVTVDFNKDLIGLTPEQQQVAEKKLSTYSMLEGGIISAGVALGRAQVAAESLGLGSVTMAGALRSFELYEERLNLPKLVKAVMGFSIGYPAQEPGIKPKLPLSGILMTDRYSQVQMTQAVTAYDRTMVDYYAKRHMDNSWIKNNMTLVARRFDTTQLDEYPKTKGFRLS
ncbi:MULTISPECIES: nitroreductase family protein [Leuconostoc]|uniref:Nitro/flavin reductase n=2 Tax=Leuconostoc kimchii TaxID=136609 RepID=D5T456_LEUKI|nr:MULTISPECIES: nitroreductase family protein [Leuconostoc]ADG40994.1 nitro/flavin reductase [Leuconostoc kimchii IMSNU 11154]AEJ31032.1 nitro/flavin reductase [Leuconostoc sp. C2]QBR48126.1 NADPH-dependent oxidoreductase [Leuconostoc kimchii]